LVVDDADVIRKTLRNFLREEPAIKLLGEASNFSEAISMTAALKPDVILSDLHMPDDRSFNPEFVKADLSGARVLAMSLSSDYESEDETGLLAESFGAVTMLDKAKLCDELIPGDFANSESCLQGSRRIGYVSLVIHGLVPTIRAFKLLTAF
jgi:chemotaxis response regulator CheB